MQTAHFRAGSQRPPAFLGNTNAMFAGDYAIVFDDPSKQFVQRRIPPLLMTDLRVVHHHVDMNIAVARMTETGHRHAVLFGAER